MNFNPMQLMQIKTDIDGFKARHPKLEYFFADAINRMDEGSILEISLTDTNGSKIRTNLKVTPEDKALIEKLSNMMKQ
jgi:hypothetical protein